MPLDNLKKEIEDLIALGYEGGYWDYKEDYSVRNQVDYLYQVERYCEEQLFKFRNMGQSTIDELRAICEQYGIYIYSHRDLSVEEIGVSFAQSYYEKIYGSGIRCIDDVINTSKVELARLFGKNSVTYKKLIQIKDYEEQRKKENALAEKR